MQRIGYGVAPTAAFGPEAVLAGLIPIRRYNVLVGLLILTGSLYYVWWTFVLSSSLHINGYPNPALNTELVTTRYTFSWWCVMVMSWNGLLPLLLLFCIVNNGIEEYNRLHLWLADMSMTVNLALIVLLSFQWLALTNKSWTGWATAFNDYRWCCVYFPSQWCPNAVPCVPAVSAANLSINYEGLMHWTFAWVFYYVAKLHVYLNRNALEFGMLK